MTNMEWQLRFATLRDSVQPSNQRNMKLTTGRQNTYGEYQGDTQWECYCKFINDILRTIRKGERDYCYHEYQICDLLRFEHDRLMAEWLPHHKCFVVFLA